MKHLLPLAALLLAPLLAPHAADLPSGAATIRAPAGASEIVITTTPRVAGAIHSLTWNGREFINSFDHGRQLQSASNLDCGTPITSETYNPTEAGSSRDFTGERSTSRLLSLCAGSNSLETLTRMAFWLAPGEKSGANPAKNTAALSDHLLAKRVRIGYKNLPHVIAYDVTFRLPPGERHTQAVFEALTGYMPPEFETFSQFDPQTRKLEPLSDGPGEGPHPIVFSVPGGRHAMGIYAPPQPAPRTTGPTYGRWRFRAQSVVKWNCVFRVADKGGLAPGDYAFRLFVVVGDLATVTASLQALLRLAAVPEPVAAPAAKPNIVFILTDDMGWGDLGCFGNKETATPNIDRLARQGLRFTQFYAASPICSPSRVAYTTGCFPARWRINDYLHSRAGNQAHGCANWLDPKAPTLARALHDAGYATAHFGKWHMGGGRDVQDAPLPSAYGFDEHHVNCEGCGPRINTFGSAQPEPVEGQMLARYAFTGFWADKAMDFMRRHKRGPFFVELWPQDVHTPHVPNPEELPGVEGTPKGHRAFNAVLKGYDREIGRVLDFLKAEGLEQNTIVLFAADNGPEPSFERQRTGGLRGMKWSLYEGGVREPFLARWPARIPAGKTDATTVLAAVDLFPTLCALAGVALPEGAGLDGLDASAAFLGTPLPRGRPLFWEYGRQADYLFPREPGARSPNLAIRDGQWKLLVNADGAGAELYDVTADPNEAKNLATENPAEAERLRQALLAWRKELPSL